MSSIEIDGCLSKKARARLQSKKPLTIVIKGVGSFKAYIQGFEEERDVFPLYSYGGPGPVRMHLGPTTTKLKTSSLYIRK